MDDSAAAMTAAVAANRHRKYRVKSINQFALVIVGLLGEEDAIVSREHICRLGNARRTVIDRAWGLIR